MNDVFWRRFFVICGVWNLLLVGLPMALAPSFMASTSGLVLPAGDWLFVRMAGLAVAAFGVGYFMVASDLDRHRSIVVVGLIGKIAVGLMFLFYWFGGTIGFRAFLSGATDFVFAGFFIRFLTRYPAR